MIISTLSREERDLGILVDSELNFSSHYEAVVKKASKVAGMIRRNFSCEDDKCLLRSISPCRPILEYGHCSTKPYKDIDALENVQRRITKFSPRLRFLPYEERLRKLEIPTLAYRFHRGDLIEMYKLCNGAYDNVPAQRIVQFNKNHLEDISTSEYGTLLQVHGPMDFRQPSCSALEQLTKKSNLLHKPTDIQEGS